MNFSKLWGIRAEWLSSLIIPVVLCRALCLALGAHEDDGGHAAHGGQAADHHDGREQALPAMELRRFALLGLLDLVVQEGSGRPQSQDHGHEGHDQERVHGFAIVRGLFIVP